jgi:hypothetical protein
MAATTRLRVTPDAGRASATRTLLAVHVEVDAGRHHESDHVLTLAYSVLSVGTRLEDVDRLRTTCR